MRVAYVKSPHAPPTETNLVEYWSTFSDRCDDSIASIRVQWQERVRTLGPPPVTLSNIVPGVVSLRSIYVATILGIFATVILAIWRAACPTRRMDCVTSIKTPSHLMSINEAGTNACAVAILLPADSVKLHQSVWVHLRHATYAGLLATALLQCIGW